MDEAHQTEFGEVKRRVRTAGGGASMSVRNLRIREDTAKYLLNLDVDRRANRPHTPVQAPVGRIALPVRAPCAPAARATLLACCVGARARAARHHIPPPSQLLVRAACWGGASSVYCPCVCT